MPGRSIIFISPFQFGKKSHGGRTELELEELCTHNYFYFLYRTSYSWPSTVLVRKM